MEGIKMNEMQKTQIEKQLELLSNNTETLEIPKNYLKGIKERISAIRIGKTGKGTKYVLP